MFNSQFINRPYANQNVLNSQVPLMVRGVAPVHLPVKSVIVGQNIPPNRTVPIQGNVNRVQLVQNVPMNNQNPPPYIKPKGSRIPMMQDHTGKLSLTNKVGGSPYGKVSLAGQNSGVQQKK